MDKRYLAGAAAALGIVISLGLPLSIFSDAPLATCPRVASAQDTPCRAQESTINALHTEIAGDIQVHEDYEATIAYLSTEVALADEILAEGLEEEIPIDMLEHLIRHVRTRGGVEIFDQPDDSIDRMYATPANFYPHVAGQNEDGTWLYIYYFVNGEQDDGWIPRDQVILNDTQVDNLPVINPDEMPEMPEIEFSARANFTTRVQRRPTPTPTAQPPQNPAPAPITSP